MQGMIALSVMVWVWLYGLRRLGVPWTPAYGSAVLASLLTYYVIICWAALS